MIESRAEQVGVRRQSGAPLVMKTFEFAVELCPSGMLVGEVLNVPGAYSQATSLDEMRANLVEVLELVGEVGEGEPLTLVLSEDSSQIDGLADSGRSVQ